VCDSNVEVIVNSKMYEIFVINVHHVPKIHLTDALTDTSDQVESERFISSAV
jgi:hypothetical protein